MEDQDRTASITEELHEREKELDALYRLSSRLARRVDDTESLFHDTADILVQSLRYPDAVLVEISAESCRAVRGSDGPVQDSIRKQHIYSMEKQLLLEVSYVSPDSSNPMRFDSREQYLIGSTAMLLADVLERRDMDQMVRETAKVLQQQASELEEKNIALRQVLSQIEYERSEMKRQTRQYISSFVHPLITQLLQSPSIADENRSRLLQLEQLIQQIAGTPSPGLTDLSGKLTPRELEISILIRNGLSTKEIALLLHISEPTVERHRNTIREKLKLTGRQVNLTTHLRSIL